MQEQMRNYIGHLKVFGSQVRGVQGRKRIVFAPGLFFLLLGLTALIAPRLLLAVIAGVFLLVGVLMIYVALKFLELKNKGEALYKEFQSRGFAGQIFVQSGPPQDIFTEEDPRRGKDGKSTKIIMH